MPTAKPPLLWERAGLEARKPASQREVRRLLTKEVVNSIGERPAQEIMRKDVIQLVNVMVERGSNVLGGNMLRELSAAYEFALGLGYLDENYANPALLAKAGFAQARVKLTCEPGKRVFSEEELTLLLGWLPTSDYPTHIKNVLFLTLLTGCRTGEICALAWKDVNLDKGIIHLQETKNGMGRYVQLSRQAILFLQSLDTQAERYLFPSRLTRKPIQQEYLATAGGQLRAQGKMLDIPRWKPHDIRRTVRTGLARIGCPNEIAEAVLGHSPKGIVGVYNLHSYDKECKLWLQKWADYLDTLTEQK